MATPNDWQTIPDNATVEDVLGATLNNNNAGVLWKYRAETCEAWAKDIEKVYSK